MVSRALVVGLGSIGKRHLRLLREALPNADIRVLRHSGCDGDIPGADGCFDDLSDACAFAPEVSIVANPAPFHLAAAQALVGAGSHLLIEKPVAAAIDGVAALLASASAQNLIVQVGYNLRQMSTLQRFRAEVQGGRIGPVQVVRCEIGQYLPDWRPGADYRGGVSARRELGGGVLLELSHELDLLRWVFGDVAWISAWTGQQSELEMDVEDSAHLTLGFANGLVGQLGMDVIRRDTTRTCTAISTTGSLQWDAVAGEVRLFDPETGGWSVLVKDKPDRDATYRDQIGHLLGAVAASHPFSPTATGDDGLAVLNMVEAARQSDAADGRRIKVAAS